MPNPPSVYAAGYEKARALDPDRADAYIKYTMIGDPLADAAAESLAEFDQVRTHHLIRAGMERDEVGLREAPEALRAFFAAIDTPPPFFDPAKTCAGSRAFHKYSDAFFVGLVLDAVITGFTTAVSKAFFMTGRTLNNLRRVKQNTRHLVEITMPGGLDRLGDGWKLSVRIRLVHAQVRRLLLESNQWDVAADGVPLHAAHMALAATGFSAVNLRAVDKLGIHLTDEERESFMHIWRYAAWLIGVPEEILFDSEDDAIALKDIAYQCEPRPKKESIALAHGNISIIPELVGIEEPAKQKRLTDFLFRTSRALMGDELADALQYPKHTTFWVMPFIRMQRRLGILRTKIVPGAMSHAATNFIGLMQRSVYDDVGISYRMPDAAREEKSNAW